MPHIDDQPRAMTTLERRNLVLELIPYAGKGTITKIEVYLRVLEMLPGSSFCDRTIERDLKAFYESGKIENLGPAGGAKQWHRIDQAPPCSPQDGQLKSAKVALGMVMLIEHASHLVHRAALKDLQDNYQQSRHLLNKLHPLEGRWLNKVVTGTQHLQLLPAQINESFLHEVQQALIEGYQLAIRYYSRRSREEKSKIISPLGLSYQDSSIYVVCLEADEPEVRTLPLHRFRAIKPLEARLAREPSNFDLRQHVQRILVEDQPIQLKMRISPALRDRLDVSETPLSKKQRLTPMHDGCWLLECEIEYTQGLEWWVLSHGATLEVLEPLSLRQAIATAAHAMAGFYSDLKDSATSAVAAKI
jgi:predicted DNA-binding transcriptional regulator YafY